MNRKSYRVIVLAVCVMTLVLASMACDTDSTRRDVQNANSRIMQDSGRWIEKHSSGEWSRDCMSVWDDKCK